MAASHSASDADHLGRLGPPDSAAVWPRLSVTGSRFTPRSHPSVRSPAAHRANCRVCVGGDQLHRDYPLMKFFFFHLMPYAALDLAGAAKYKSVSVLLPNSFYDPVQ